MTTSKIKKIATKGIVTFCGLGLSPVAPGTVGSLGAVILWIATHYAYPHILTGYYLILIGFGLNLIFVPKYLKNNTHKDPKEVVIDEVLGQWIALTSAGTNLLLVFISFALFRVFDILKPWPINKIDQLSGSTVKNTFSLVFDDVLAGLSAAGLLFLIKIFLG